MSVANSLSDAQWTAATRLLNTSDRPRQSPPVVSMTHTSQSSTPPAARVKHRASGRVMALIGSVNILLGELFSDSHRTSRGHRQRVIGVLQSNCEVDRRVAGEFVDRWMSKHPLLRIVG